MDSAGGGAPWRGSRSQPNSSPAAGGPGGQRGPPSQIQGAMMKDKKPFTYTPGGIDLSEIRSPRMAKRIQMNAAAEGVTSVPQPSGNSLSPGGGYHLPPASIAAMQPQLPVAVFPQGGLSPSNLSNLHRTHKPSDFSQPAENVTSNGHVQGMPPPPPPPPPAPPMQNIPPPPPERFSIPSPNSEPRPRNFKETHQEAAIAPRPSNAPPLSLASFMKQTIKAIPDYDEDSEQQLRPSQFASRPTPPAPPQSMNSQPEQRSPQIQVQRPVQSVTSQPQPQAEQRSPQIQAHRPVKFINPTQNQPPEESSPPVQTQAQNHAHHQNQPQFQVEPRSQQLYSQRAPPTVSSPQVEQNNHVYDEHRRGPSGGPRPYHQPQHQQRVEQKSPIQVRSPPVQTKASEPVLEQKIPMSIFQSERENSEQSPLVFQQVTSPNGAPIYQHKPGRQIQVQQPSTSTASAPAGNTKILNLGTLYIPPIQQLSAKNDREGNGTPAIQRNSSTESESDKDRSAPQTPQLNKAPTPWMNSRNKMPQQSSPSFTSAGNTPWGKAKVIPINLVDNRADSGDVDSESVQQPRMTAPAVTPNVSRPNQAGAMSNGGRIIPIQIERTPDASAGQSVRTPPTINSRSTPYFMQTQQQTGESAASASNDRSVGNDGQWGDPTQSKSFRVLQKITSEDTDDASPPVQTSSGRGQTIQIRVEPQMQPMPGSQQQFQFPVEYIAAENPGQKVHPSQQKVSEPKLYMGKNIPSRSFKMLQQLTGEDGPSNSAFGSRVGDDHANISLSVPSLASAASNPYPEGIPQLGHTSNVDIDIDVQEAASEKAALDMPEDFDPNEINWDPSSYWYYWWYCASHFWNGREYEFPEGWEPYNGRNFQDWPDEDVVYPFADQMVGEDAALAIASDTTTIPGYRASTRTSNLEFKPVLAYVPETEETEAIVHAGEPESETDENEYRNETIETDRGHETKITTSPDVDGSFEISAGIVEEPETPTSTISDITSPLIIEGSCSGVAGLLIEECFSDDSELASLRGRKRLSTIDELSQSEKSLTAIIASISSASACAPKREVAVAEECQSDYLDLWTSDDETSHASVIAKKSETEANNADTPNLNMDGNLELEQDEIAELSTAAVSVRLPLTLSFSKSKSYRDVTTVLIGATQVEEGKLHAEGEGHDSDDHVSKSSEESEPKSDEYVSVGSLVINPSKEKVTEGMQDLEKEDLQHSPMREDKVSEVDFWGEIMKPHQEFSEEKNNDEVQAIESKNANPDTSPASDDDNESVDFWSVLNKEPDNGGEEPKEKEANFWEKSVTSNDASNFWDSSGNFQFSGDGSADGIENTAETEAESCGTSESNDNSESEEESSTESDTDDPLEPYSLNIEPSIKVEESVASNSIEVEGVSTLRQNSNKSDDISDESKSSDERTIVPDEKTEAFLAAEAAGTPIEASSITEQAAEGQKLVITREVPIQVESGASCNCPATEKLARAENLLWRIEKFLQETLLLGTENDSGILTDISRQLSDYETDNDGEFEAYAQSSKRGRDFQPTLTEIESFTSEERSVEKIEPSPSVPTATTEESAETSLEESPVTLRGTEAERKARKYERAKTHSRLFELLQGDGEREDALPEEEESKAEADAETLPNPGTIPVAVCDDGLPEATENYRNVPITMDSKKNTPPRDCRDSSEARSRLIPLPIKSNLTTSLSIDSNSSYSGSSSMLSPTSPNRDQILTDIINQFQQRHQQTLKAHFNSKRLKHFPSKIFNILQQEFGQEFYDVFDVGYDLLATPQQLPVEIAGGDLDFRSIQDIDSARSELREHKIFCSGTNAPETKTKNDNEQSMMAMITAEEEKLALTLKSVSQSPKAKLGRDPRIAKSFKK